MRKAVFWISFGLILFLAALLRLYRLGQTPYSLYWDEAAMFVDVKSVLQTGHDMHGGPWYQVIYPSYGDYKLPVYIWLSLVTNKLFGLSEFSMRLPSVLAGLGTIVVGGVLARELVQKKKELVQLLTMLTIAITPWAVMFSRTGFEGHVAQFFLALSVLCVVVSRKRPWMVYLSPFFGAVATYTYFSVRFVWVIVFICAVLLTIKTFSKKEMVPLFLTKLLLPLILFGILFVPMWRSPLYKDANRFRLGTDSVLNTDAQVTQSNVYRQMAGNSRADRVFFHHDWLTIRELLAHYSDNLSPNFMFVTGDPNFRHGTGHEGLFLLIFLPFFLAGLYVVFTKQPKVFFVLFIWWIVALLPASVPNNTPHALRSLNALVPLTIFIGIGWAEIIERLHKSRVALILLAACVCGSTLLFLFHYFVIYPHESAQDWQDGYKQLAQHLFAVRKNNEPIYIVQFDDRFYLWLMAYGPYTGKDFQSWKSRDYKFDSLPGISFQTPDKKTLTQNAPALVAGQPDAVKALVAKNTFDVKGSDGTVRFMIGEFQK